MKTAAVIAEFNPFHNGHAYLIEQARKKLGVDRVLVLMSGDFVQKGAPAIADMHTRAYMSLLAGADLVMLYPARFSTASAEAFAEHAVRILNGLHEVDYLVFGSESGDLDLMDRAAEALAAESDAFRAALQKGLKDGLSFPAARAQALPEYAQLLSQPNNILAVEYLKALRKTDSPIRPFTVKREGSDYLDETHLTELASASAVRHELIKGTNIPGLSVALPKASFAVLKENIGTYGMAVPNDYSLILADRLWKLGDPALLAAHEDVTEDLAKTILKRRNLFTSVEEFADLCKSKSVTRTHVCRALFHLILGIRKNRELDATHLTAVLGFREAASDLLSAVTKKADIPVLITLAKDAAHLNAAQKKLFDEDVRIANLYESVRAQKSGGRFCNVLSRQVVKV